MILVVLLPVAPIRMSSQILPADTLIADTAARAREDSLARSFIRPIPLVGSIDRNLPAGRVITDSMINFTDYRYLGDLLTPTPGVYVRELAGPGQYNDFTIEGLGPRGVAFLADGVELSDPFSGIFNPYLSPTENIDRIELISGPRAFLYGFNSTGGVVNLTSKSKKAIHPYSRIRYSESADGFALVDGMVSQDLIRGLNVTAGFQHHTFGERFPNDDYDHWNGRFKIRYNIGSNLNVFASEMYNQTRLGLNGGVDIATTPPADWFDVRSAQMVNTSAYEKITRHDLQVGAAVRPEGDSNAVSTLTLYLSSHLREYRNGENQFSTTPAVREDDHADWLGAKLTIHQLLAGQSADLGAEMQSQRVYSPVSIRTRPVLFNVYGLTDLHPLGIVTLSPYGRFDSYRSEQRLSWGGDGVLSFGAGFEAFGGYSQSYRFPTIQEREGTPGVVSSAILDETPERHHLLEAGVRLSGNDLLSFEAKAFQRIIWDPIVVAPQNIADASVPYVFSRHGKMILRGADATASLRLGSFVFDGVAQYVERVDHEDDVIDFPRWTGTGGGYYWGKLFGGHLDLKTGFRGRILSAFAGREFNQQAIVYVPNDQPYNISLTGTVDFVLIAHLGSAYLHFIWVNLGDRQYVTTAFYPMTDRSVRFGVSWDLQD